MRETVPKVLCTGRGRYSDSIASDIAFSFLELLLNCIAASHKSLKSVPYLLLNTRQIIGLIVQFA